MNHPWLTDLLTRWHGTSAAPAPMVAATAICAPWCQGRGARRIGDATMPVPTDRMPSALETLRRIEHEYCPCPAGTAARERHRSSLAALETAATQRNADRLWESAKIPPKLRAYSLETYRALPGARPALVETVRRWQRLARTDGRSLVLRGNPGTHKTGVAASLLLEDVAAGHSGLFLLFDDFLAEVRMTNQPGNSFDDNAAKETEMIGSAAGVGLLVLDDVGTMTDWGRKILLRLIDRRLNWRRPTIITTNLDLAELETQVGKRVFDRLREATQPTPADESFMVHVKGGSQRGMAA